MKRLFRLWMLLMPMALGITSCTDIDDNPVENPPAEPSVGVDERDELTVRLQMPTYVFPDAYDGIGDALVDRVTIAAGSLYDDAVETVILHNNHIVTLTDEEIGGILLVMARGGNIVINEPLLSGLEQFYEKIAAWLDKDVDEDDVMNIVERITEEDGADAIQYLNQIARDEDFSMLTNADGESDYLELYCIRGNDIYFAFNPREGEADEMQYTYESIDDEGNIVEEANTQTEIEQIEMTERMAGIKADNCARWLNECLEDPAKSRDADKAEARQAATRAAFTEIDLDRLISGQKATFDIGQKVSHPANSSWYRNVQLVYTVWPAYSFNDGKDYYLISQKVTSFNAEKYRQSNGLTLYVGPDNHEKWWYLNGDVYKEEYGYYDDDFKKKTCYYGPYMRKINLECSLEDNAQKSLAGLTVEDWSPKRDVNSGVTTSEGFDFGIGGDVGFSGTSFGANISPSFSWSKSVEKFSPDLKLDADRKTNGTLTWNYTGNRPDTNWGNWWSGRVDHKSAAPEILRTTCEVDQAWVWSVKTTGNSVTIHTTANVAAEWMMFKNTNTCWKPTVATFQTLENKKDVRMTVYCPPHYRQEWAMRVEPRNSYIVDALQKDYPRYYLANFELAAQEANGYDEINQFYADTKKIFDNDLRNLKGIAEGANVQSFTIYWKHLNGNGKELKYTVTK